MKFIMKPKRIITICSSASFYRDVLEVEEQLKRMGFTVKVPSTAHKMKKAGIMMSHIGKHGSKIKVITKRRLSL